MEILTVASTIAGVVAVFFLADVLKDWLSLLLWGRVCGLKVADLCTNACSSVSYAIYMLCATTVRCGRQHLPFLWFCVLASGCKCIVCGTCVPLCFQGAASVGLIQLHKLKQETVLPCHSPLCLEYGLE